MKLTATQTQDALVLLVTDSDPNSDTPLRRYILESDSSTVHGCVLVPLKPRGPKKALNRKNTSTTYAEAPLDPKDELDRKHFLHLWHEAAERHQRP